MARTKAQRSRRIPAPGIAAVRGAVPVKANRPEEILAATTRLLTTLARLNQLDPARIVSALFTTTADLDAEFPAHAARRLGWGDVPMLHAREIPVPGSMPRVVRVLVTVREAKRALQPVYLDEAAALRPDLFAAPRSRPTPVAESAAARPGGRGRRVALIGVGQIGGSLGLALAGSRWRRIGWDRDARTLARALERGALDEIAPSLSAACASADLAIVATPVDTLPRLIRAAASALPRGAALLDTGSARAGVTPALREAARRGVRAVGGHPIAGTEGRGIAAARPDLFRGANFVLLPVRGAVPPVVRAVVRDVGAHVLRVSPAEHDRALARTSHLPYLIARALREEGVRFARAGLSGPGFRDMTRLAGSDPRMAEAFCRANAAEIRRAWRALKQRIERRVRR